jgi:hypothetical protein
MSLTLINVKNSGKLNQTGRRITGAAARGASCTIVKTSSCPFAMVACKLLNDILLMCDRGDAYGS